EPTVTAGYETSGHSPGSDHYAGQALDFVTPSGAGDAAKVQAVADKYGIDLLDEYTNPSAASTGGHFHISGDGTVPEGLQVANNKGSSKKSGGSSAGGSSPAGQAQGGSSGGSGAGASSGTGGSSGGGGSAGAGGSSGAGGGSKPKRSSAPKPTKPNTQAA